MVKNVCSLHKDPGLTLGTPPPVKNGRKGQRLGETEVHRATMRGQAALLPGLFLCAPSLLNHVASPMCRSFLMEASYPRAPALLL